MNTDGLDAMLKEKQSGMSFPEITKEDERKARNMMAGSITPITVCNDCGSVEIMHRLGCRCSWSQNVKWLFTDSSGSQLKHGRDFLFIEDRPLTEYT
ncbi:hypothetical protein QRC94_003782 [Vibrio vulnificus]|nr:hypothetical protein [Vibrio vulnificus]ELR8547962.1 hypothetical protein [Vibrio vulnificus]ELR8552716.1 hypothetical protein [Vibrio vulnificus]